MHSGTLTDDPGTTKEDGSGEESLAIVRQASNDERTSQADVLANYANDCAVFIDAADGSTVYADVTTDDHRETVRVESSAFRDWLRRRYYLDCHKSARADAIGQAIETIRACALFGPQPDRRAVSVRTARAGDTHYIDLGDSSWQAVEISVDGWGIVTAPPVRFRRNAGLAALPLPTRVDPKDGLALLRPFINTKSEDDFVLLVIWMLYVLRGVAPYPVLPLTGEHGAGKSTLCRVLKRILDPHQLSLRAASSNEQDLLLAATRQHVLCFDNVSGIQPWMSDALCRIADGAGMGKRKLYSDDDEATLIAACPILLNGITDFVTRPDLADRSVFIALEAIPDEARKDDAEIAADFEAVLPSILGGLLEAVSHGLRTLPSIRPDKLPRMAGFARWGAACEGVFWPNGTFESAYAANRRAADEAVLEADAMVPILRDWLESNAPDGWSGRTSGLTAFLKEAADASPGKPSSAKEWPSTSQRLSAALKRATPSLRKVGLEVTLDRKGGRSHVTIRRLTKAPAQVRELHTATSNFGASSDETHRSTSRTCEGVIGGDASPEDRLAADNGARVFPLRGRL